jgi:ribonuclease HI
MHAAFFQKLGHDENERADELAREGMAPFRR